MALCALPVFFGKMTGKLAYLKYIHTDRISESKVGFKNLYVVSETGNKLGYIAAVFKNMTKNVYIRIRTVSHKSAFHPFAYSVLNSAS